MPTAIQSRGFLFSPTIFALLLSGCSETFLAARQAEWEAAQKGSSESPHCPDGHVHQRGDAVWVDHHPRDVVASLGKPQMVLAMDTGGLALLYENPARKCVETYQVGLNSKIIQVECI